MPPKVLEVVARWGISLVGASTLGLFSAGDDGQSSPDSIGHFGGDGDLESEEAHVGGKALDGKWAVHQGGVG